MSRQPRHFESGAVYHLISRFVDREWFIRDDDERRNYLRLLGRALSRTDWRCFSFAVMSNHIHLGAIAGRQPLDRWIRRVHSPFADSMNRAYGRIGPMFVRGPKGIHVPRSAVGSVIAYIHNNPVRAKLVERASASTWTSHRAYVGAEVAPPWLDVEAGIALAGSSDPAEFDRWVMDPARAEFDVAHDAELEAGTPRANEQRPFRPDAASIVAATACEVGITVSQLCSRRRTPVEVIARQVAVHCAECSGVTGADIARALGLTQQAASFIRCRGVGSEAFEIGTRVLRRLSETRIP